jgi:hypothetical protein
MDRPSMIAFTPVITHKAGAYVGSAGIAQNGEVFLRTPQTGPWKFVTSGVLWT